MDRISTAIIGIYIPFIYHPNSSLKMENRLSPIRSNTFNTIFLTSDFCCSLSSIVRTAKLPQQQEGTLLDNYEKRFLHEKS